MDTEPLIALDPAWPKMSLTEAEAILTAPGGMFEMETLAIDGVPTRVWKNAPPSLAWLIQASRAHGERLFTIHEDERVTYEANFRAVATLATRLAELGVTKGRPRRAGDAQPARMAGDLLCRRQHRGDRRAAQRLVDGGRA